MPTIDVSSLDIPPEYMVLSGSMPDGWTGLLPSTCYSLIIYDEERFGLLIRKGSKAQQLFASGSFFINILQEAKIITADDVIRADEHAMEAASSVCVDALVAVEAHVQRRIDLAAYTLLVCDAHAIIRQKKCSIEQRLKQLGLAPAVNIKVM
jgi:hypothetical protein